MYYSSKPSTVKSVDVQESSNSDTDTAINSDTDTIASTCNSSSATLSCNESSSATLSADEPIAESFQARRSQSSYLSSSSSSSSSSCSSSCSSSSSSPSSSIENSSSIQTGNSAAFVPTVSTNEILLQKPIEYPHKKHFPVALSSEMDSATNYQNTSSVQNWNPAVLVPTVANSQEVLSRETEPVPIHRQRNLQVSASLPAPPLAETSRSFQKTSTNKYEMPFSIQDWTHAVLGLPVFKNQVVVRNETDSDPSTSTRKSPPLTTVLPLKKKKPQRSNESSVSSSAFSASKTPGTAQRTSTSNYGNSSSIQKWNSAALVPTVSKSRVVLSSKTDSAHSTPTRKFPPLTRVRHSTKDPQPHNRPSASAAAPSRSETPGTFQRTIINNYEASSSIQNRNSSVLLPLLFNNVVRNSETDLAVPSTLSRESQPLMTVLQCKGKPQPNNESSAASPALATSETLRISQKAFSNNNKYYLIQNWTSAVLMPTVSGNQVVSAASTSTRKPPLLTTLPSRKRKPQPSNEPSIPSPVPLPVETSRSSQKTFTKNYEMSPSVQKGNFEVFVPTISNNQVDIHMDTDSTASASTRKSSPLTTVLRFKKKLQSSNESSFSSSVLSPSETPDTSQGTFTNNHENFSSIQNWNSEVSAVSNNQVVLSSATDSSALVSTRKSPTLTTVPHRKKKLYASNASSASSRAPSSSETLEGSQRTFTKAYENFSSVQNWNLLVPTVINNQVDISSDTDSTRKSSPLTTVLRFNKKPQSSNESSSSSPVISSSETRGTSQRSFTNNHEQFSSIQNWNSAVSTVSNNQVVRSSETDSSAPASTRKSPPLKTVPHRKRKSYIGSASSTSSPSGSSFDMPGSSQRTVTKTYANSSSVQNWNFDVLVPTVINNQVDVSSDTDSTASTSTRKSPPLTTAVRFTKKPQPSHESSASSPVLSSPETPGTFQRSFSNNYEHFSSIQNWNSEVSTVSINQVVLGSETDSSAPDLVRKSTPLTAVPHRKRKSYISSASSASSPSASSFEMPGSSQRTVAKTYENSSSVQHWNVNVDISSHTNSTASTSTRKSPPLTTVLRFTKKPQPSHESSASSPALSPSDTSGASETAFTNNYGNFSSIQTWKPVILTSPISISQAIPSSETDSTASASSRKSPSLTTVPHRKRKPQPSNESSASSPDLSPVEVPGSSGKPRTFTNDYQMYRDVRKQIEERHRSLFLVRPRGPQDFQDYLLCRKSYILAGTAPSEPEVRYPSNLDLQMRELYKKQEVERYKLRMQHIIQQQKFVLSIEQQIMRTHTKAARILTDQNRPLSACTILRDKEVYSLNTPEQERKERQSGLAFDNKLFVEWLKEIDDKSERIKNQLISTQNLEAQSLHAVQRMDWEIKLRELKKPVTIDPLHVPMV